MRKMTGADVAVRAGHAHAVLETATDIQTLHPERANVVIHNAVMAGIAASDAICEARAGSQRPR